MVAGRPSSAAVLSVPIPQAAMPSLVPAKGSAGIDDEVRGWTSCAEDTEWKAVTESETETRQTLAKKQFQDKLAASVVEEESDACTMAPQKKSMKASAW